MGRQIILSEEQKRNIQEMYGLVNEQTADGMTYSVVPINDKFRIYVKGGKYTKPTDAETAFGKGNAWVDYNTRQDAQKTISSIVNKPKKGGLEMIEMVNEQKPSGKYKAGGTKFCFFGSCRVDIKVIDTETSQIVTSKGAEGKDVKTLYSQVIKSLQDELKSKKITDVTLPTLEQLEDTSPK